MASVTISKKEYEELLDNKLRFQYVKQSLNEDFFSPPPTRSIKEVMVAFRATGKYNKLFLQSLEKGLRRSSHFKK
ncbi:MAG: hypothetical protein A2749_00655 [Parcubacteria group bacterium RIFCSPHIGHO2_01_FULL_45_26]|nr:MAG: hypothetical protein A2749_00655 [Parcubacteria group bacterium RIFCSPHIGHO2_01_FULL_45_26]